MGIRRHLPKTGSARFKATICTDVDGARPAETARFAAGHSAENAPSSALAKAGSERVERRTSKAVICPIPPRAIAQMII
jgi:hypothetical protein